MKITKIKVENVRLQLYKPFKVSLGVIEQLNTLILKVETDEGIYGLGECSPIEFITGENIDTAAIVIKEFEKLFNIFVELDIEY